MSVTNVLIAGVGGQGTVLTAKVLSRLLIQKGYDIKVSEIHGMSQRGGSVITQVRFGDKVYSPIIDKGEADIVLAFELLEAYRALPFVKAGGKMILNSQKIDPMPVITGAAQYPADIEKKIAEKVDLAAVPALELAEKAGNARAVNVVLIGVMAKNTDIPYEHWVETIKKTVPAKFLDVNLAAFDLGFFLP